MPLDDLTYLQQNSNTVTWWYQCKKINGRFRNTMNTVSNNSGILLKMNNITQNPVGPRPQVSGGGVHIDDSKLLSTSVANKYGTFTKYLKEYHHAFEGMYIQCLRIPFCTCHKKKIYTRRRSNMREESLSRRVSIFQFLREIKGYQQIFD